MNKNSNYGQEFSAALQAKGVKPADLARALGVQPQRITHWRTRGVATRYALRVAELLDVPVSTISSVESGPPQSAADDDRRAAYVKGVGSMDSRDLLAVLESAASQLSAADKLALAVILISGAEDEI